MTNRILAHAIVDSDRTQRAIARSARMHETRLSRIISGEVKPTDTERRRLARALRKSGKSEDELFGPLADESAA